RQETTTEPSCRCATRTFDDEERPSANPTTAWPGGGTLAPVPPLQRIGVPVFSATVVLPVTVMEPESVLAPDPQPATATPTAASTISARIAFVTSLIRRRSLECHRSVPRPTTRAGAGARKGASRGRTRAS